MAAQGPLLIVFEDVHWIDPTSLELLDRMIARVPDAVVEQVLAQADGVPLFIEELTTTLLESGSLRETADSYVLAGTLSPLVIPTTLQASLAARLDRLGPGKDVAVIGAAIGREFSHDLVAAVSALAPMDLDAALERLVTAGLVYRRGVPPDIAYSFKHALVQDAAYATMLKSRRRQLHADVAKVLVERFPTQGERLPEVVARHFTEAGLASEAIGYWFKAGRLAWARSAHDEAVTCFEQALHLLDAQPQSRETMQRSIDLRFELKDALVPLGEFERVSRHLHEASRLARTLDDQRRLGFAYGHLCHVHWMIGRPTEAHRFGRNALAIAEALGDVPLQIKVTLQLGAACMWRGDYRRAEEVLRSALRRLEGRESRERIGLGRVEVAIHAYLTVVLAGLGKFEEGIAHGKEGIRLAETRVDPQSQANACLYVAHLQNARGDFSGAISLAEHARVLCQQWNLTMLSASAGGGLGHAYALSGRIAEGIAMLEQALSAFAAMRHGAALPLFHMYLGEAYILTNRRADALECARRALDAAREGDQRGHEARALCLLGEVAAAPDHAEGHFRDALALAEELGMRPLIAHCHLGLGKLYRSIGDAQRTEKHFAAATTLYRDLDMPFWLERAEVEWRQRARQAD
jgi:tetratricopeptide (TPR) repeat protein